MATERQTRRVRAYNVKAGDQIEVFDRNRHKVVRLTVHWVDDSERWAPGTVDIAFKRRTFGMRMPKTQLVRVLRPVKGKPK